MHKRHFLLAVVFILIIAAIIYIESSKVKPAISYSNTPEITAPSGFINSDNITISQFIGTKVILVDFWTYSCINCQRTIPYLNSWYDKYHHKGLEIIGIHTPEFEFEKKYDNVQKAVEKFRIKYPVVLDNQYGTWNAFRNHYWPHKFLIDLQGNIVYDHIGEGGYEETEAKIQNLLKAQEEFTTMPPPEFTKIQTPEIYFGYQFSRNQMGNFEGWMPDKTVKYAKTKSQEPNLFYLEGEWKNNPDNMELTNAGEFSIYYAAKDVYMVAEASQATRITVYVDNKEIQNLTITDSTLYHLVQGQEYGSHRLDIKSEKGLKVYTLTFG